ncbi:hypothetical protein E2C01_042338 [Portunus trituberculatus]|uniref:Uncharacterized protein n=1 Tax=Portunus trituberculatus TaxID=210409 RepID=A0A5B7FPY3_PORTR|nr:hypothetical protein [Portunus trituberculatus]
MFGETHCLSFVPIALQKFPEEAFIALHCRLFIHPSKHTMERVCGAASAQGGRRTSSSNHLRDTGLMTTRPQGRLMVPASMADCWLSSVSNPTKA